MQNEGRSRHQGQPGKQRQGWPSETTRSEKGARECHRICFHGFFRLGYSKQSVPPHSGADCSQEASSPSGGLAFTSLLTDSCRMAAETLRGIAATAVAMRVYSVRTKPKEPARRDGHRGVAGRQGAHPSRFSAATQRKRYLFQTSSRATHMPGCLGMLTQSCWIQTFSLRRRSACPS